MTEQHYLIKDDSELVEMIQRSAQQRRQMGIPEPTEEFNIREASNEWHEMRKRRRGPRQLYHIVIEPAGNLYRASPLILPSVVAQGETPQAAKANVITALRSYFKKLLTQGQPLPIESKMVELVEVAMA